MKTVAYSLAVVGLGIYSGRPDHQVTLSGGDEPTVTSTTTTVDADAADADATAAPVESAKAPQLIVPGNYSVNYAPAGKDLAPRETTLVVGCDLTFKQVSDKDGTSGESDSPHFFGKGKSVDNGCKEQKDGNDKVWSGKDGLRFYVDSLDAKEKRECLVVNNDKGGNHLDGVHYEDLAGDKYYGRVRYTLKKGKNATCDDGCTGFVTPGTYKIEYAKKGEKLGKRDATLTVACDGSWTHKSKGKPNVGVATRITNHTEDGCTAQAGKKGNVDHDWSQPEGLKFYVDNLDAPGKRECLGRAADGGYTGTHYLEGGEYWGTVKYTLVGKATKCESCPIY